LFRLVKMGDVMKPRASKYITDERRGAGDCVPFIQQSSNVEIAGILYLSRGGSRATSTLVAAGRSK
jgi:hypothetical protein